MALNADLGYREYVSGIGEVRGRWSLAVWKARRFACPVQMCAVLELAAHTHPSETNEMRGKKQISSHTYPANK